MKYTTALLPLAAGTLAASGAGPRPNATFQTFQPGFSEIISATSKIELLHENTTYPFAHEAPVYIPSTGDLFLVGNYQTPKGGAPIQISRMFKNNATSSTGNGQYTYGREIIHPDVPMANGGINYKDGILFCAQGTFAQKSALIWMNVTAPYNTKVLLDNFHGRRFNSLNDLFIHSDGSIWFTDPTYGYDQGFSPEPELPNQVYRFDPETGDVRVVADKIGQPNGIAISPDEKIVYVTDTDATWGNGNMSRRRGATIYAYDIVEYSGAPFLTNRRVFAYDESGIPDGVKIDTEGNVYAGCGDGVHIWSPAGVLLGKIYLNSTSANLAFAEKGELFVLNEYRLWKATLDDVVAGDILRF
ncbi:SMP-30/gluconolactonase/LRE family protein [Aspergillus stella-maris]|uniref:SMP-30/gluconolactonase/LRE family protein n=1 Tax=Aspergillus stella-maris TaxID=1810926 RepID=UPI003CCCC05A